MTQGSDQTTSSPSKSRFRIFVPILAGATLRERLLACLGALLGIALAGLLSGIMLGFGSDLPLLVAPLGASAVLIFAVPASPLAQPWAVVGGNTLSATTGLLVLQVVDQPALAAGLAVSLAIAVMSFARCLHPPGGAAALTAVLGGPAVESWGALFPLVPVALDSVLLLAFGLLFHRLCGRSYPHAVPPRPVNAHGTADPPPSLRAGFRRADLDAALARLDETFDIDRDDLERLLREVELQAAIRRRGDLACADIMSRDVVTIGPDAGRDEAMALLLRHNVRTLPVTDAGGRVLGTVGLRELARAEGAVGALVSEPATARPDTPAVALLPLLTDGRSHAVLITDPDARLVGLISQTDLLSALGRSPASAGGVRP